MAKKRQTLDPYEQYAVMSVHARFLKDFRRIIYTVPWPIIFQDSSDAPINQSAHTRGTVINFRLALTSQIAMVENIINAHIADHNLFQTTQDTYVTEQGLRDETQERLTRSFLSGSITGRHCGLNAVGNLCRGLLQKDNVDSTIVSHNTAVAIDHNVAKSLYSLAALLCTRNTHVAEKQFDAWARNVVAGRTLAPFDHNVHHLRTYVNSLTPARKLVDPTARAERQQLLDLAAACRPT